MIDMQRLFLGDLEIVAVYVEIIVLWQISLFFFIKSLVRREEKQLTSDLMTASGVFFLFFSLYRLFSMFYVNYGQEIIFKVLDRISLVIGALFFIILINQIFLKTIFENDKLRMIFFISLLTCMFLFVAIYYLFSSLQTLLLLLIVLAGLMSILVYFTIDWMVKTEELARRYMLVLIGGALIFLAGASISVIINYIPELINYQIVFTVIETIGLIMMGLCSYILPNLEELNWKDNIINLYVIKSEGICLFEKKFLKGEDVDKFLISGGITTIIKFVREVTKSEEKVSTIIQEGKNLIIEHGEHVFVAVVAKQDMKILHQKAKQLVKEYEHFFKDILATWKGDLDYFKPSRVLVDKIFK